MVCRAAVSARTVSEVAELRERAAAAKKRLPTFSLESAVRFSDPAAQAAFVSDLATAIKTLVAEYHDATAPVGRWFRLTAGAHPALTPPNTPPSDPERSTAGDSQ